MVTKNAAFDTETNDTFATAQSISGVQGAQGALTAGSSKLYATGSDGATLITINTTTGLANTIGSFGFPQTYAAAFTPDGTLWTIVNGFGSTASLATVNQTTGAATTLGSANFTGSPIITLEADASGNLYGGSFAGSFYSVNKHRPVHLIGPLGFGNIMDMAFDNAGAALGIDGQWVLSGEPGHRRDVQDHDLGRQRHGHGADGRPDR